ncbi:MAG: caspase family protein [Rubrivivax sp.]|nr:caspase family protein [Rubrivivax sp.]MCL4697759.1 caspase family protein [Burkholderiaceae bacterium]
MPHDPTRRAGLTAGAAALSLLSLGLPVTRARAQGGAARTALVIGNAAYARAPLTNPVRDARAMTTALRGMGFAVQELLDGFDHRVEAFETIEVPAGPRLVPR